MFVDVRQTFLVKVGIFVLLSLGLGFFVFNPVVSAAPDHLLISEVQVYGGASVDDFVELYNPTGSDVDLTGWSIQRATASGLTWNKVVLSGVIPAGEYFLIVGDGANTELQNKADLTGVGLQLTADNTVCLVGNDENLDFVSDPNEDSDLVDMVGMGSSAYFETTPAPDAVNGKSIERIFEQDTDDNGVDFVLNDNPSPQGAGEVEEPEEPDETEDGCCRCREFRDMREFREFGHSEKSWKEPREFKSLRDFREFCYCNL